jgi:carbon-monoxide dehydrogenase medium subunit
MWKMAGRESISYLIPDSIEGALEALNEGNGGSVPIAGATSPFWRRSLSFREVVDITYLPLHYIRRTGKDVCIGATTPVADLAAWKEAESFCGGVLKCAVNQLASTPLRNMITVGGNCVGLFPWSDLPPLLLILDAEFRLCSPEETLSAASFFSGHPLKAIARRRLLLEVRIPHHKSDCRGKFVKFSRTRYDRTIITIAASMRMNEDTFEEVRVATGGVELLPRRLYQVESLLEGRKPDPRLILEASRCARDEISPRKGVHWGLEWRKNLASVLTKRTLEELKQECTEKKKEAS